MGARLAQECVRITAGDFRSMIFPTQYRVPTYNHWLLYDADLAPAYRWHRRYLQHLQSRHPATQWLLKSPAHLWHLDALAGEYPDAVDRPDPSRPAQGDRLGERPRRPSPADGQRRDLDRRSGRRLCRRHLPRARPRHRGRAIGARFPADQIVDVQFAEFVAEPIPTVQRLYAALGRELTDDTEQRMRDFLAEHPGDGGGGGTPLPVRRHRARRRRAARTSGPVPTALRRRLRAGPLTARPGLPPSRETRHIMSHGPSTVHAAARPEGGPPPGPPIRSPVRIRAALTAPLLALAPMTETVSPASRLATVAVFSAATLVDDEVLTV